MKWLDIEIWASRQFDPAPSRAILRAMASSGQIWPAAQRIDRRWMVREDAGFKGLESIEVDGLSDRVRKILSMR